MNSMALTVGIIVIALIFDYINGFHDAANSIATVVSTRVLTPTVAVVWAAIFNFLAATLLGTGVAATVGSGFVNVQLVTPWVLLAGIVGAILWDLLTWYMALPTSSSHALIGGYAGAAFAKAGFCWFGRWKMGHHGGVHRSFPAHRTVDGISADGGRVLDISPFLASTNREAFPPISDSFRSAVQRCAHGTNDSAENDGDYHCRSGGKREEMQHDSHVPAWVIVASSTAIGAGTMSGGWRIVRTMGTRLTRLQPHSGFCAETGAAISVLFATYLGLPVSSTHAIAGAIAGVGSIQRTRAVRWHVASGIVTAWVLTIPASAGMAAVLYYGMRLFMPGV